MSEETRSPIIATRPGLAEPFPREVEEVPLGLAADLGAAPLAVSTAARIAPVPGQAPPGIGSVGSRLVATSLASPWRASVAVRSSS